MKHIKVIKEFTFPIDMKLVKFLVGTYLVKADDRNGSDEYVCKDWNSVTANVVKANADYFIEVSETEYNQSVIDFTEIKKLLDKMTKKHELNHADLIKKVCEALDIPLLNFTIDWNLTTPIQPYNPGLPYQPYTQGTCPQCLQPGGSACFSVHCPNRNLITYSTDTNGTK